MHTNRNRSREKRSEKAGPDRDPVPERKRVFFRPSGSRLRRRRNLAIDRSQNARASTPLRWITIAAVVFAACFLLVQTRVWAQDGGPNSPTQSVGLSDVLVVIVLVFITGLFALAEAALLTVRRTRIEQLVEEGNRSARLVAKLLAEPTRTLATLQVGLTLVQLFSAGEATDRFREPFAAWLRAQFGRNFIGSHSEAIAFVTIILTVGLLTLVIGEITPKSIAIKHAEGISLLVAWPIRGLQIVASPLVSIVTFLSNLLVRPFGGTATFHASPHSEEELKLIVEESEEHGVIETEEKEMIHSIFEFGETIVRKVMTPRPEITWVEADASVEELIRTVTESGHSRLPVYDDVQDNVVGIVHVKDVLRAVSEELLADSAAELQQDAAAHAEAVAEPSRLHALQHASIRQLMRPPYVIPENKRVDDLLKEFRRSKTQMAIVMDEHGAVSGVVTVEDLLEEIVGEIQDEYDAEEEPIVTVVDEHTCVVDGRMDLDDFNERMGVELPDDEADTVGGFVFGLLGHQPRPGEAAKWDGLEFRVEATDGRRIQKVCVIKSPPPEPPTSEEGSPSPNGHSPTSPETRTPNRTPVEGQG